MILPSFTPLPAGYRFDHDGGMLAMPDRLAAGAADALASEDRYDGDIVSVKTVGRDRLIATTARYGHFLAERDRTGARQVRPLAVMGIGLVQGKYLFGRRDRRVLQEAGSLEFAPSGGVEAKRVGVDGTIDLAGQLVSEVEEECGVPADPASVRAIGLVDDPGTGVTDVVCLFELGCPEDVLLEAHRARATREYDTLLLIDSDWIARWHDWPEPVGRATATVLDGVDLAALRPA